MTALSFEAVKIAFRQDKNGYILTLSIHPNDVPKDLYLHPVGQIYGVAIVPLGGDGVSAEADPKKKPKPKPTKGEFSDGEKALRHMRALCRDENFMSWLTGVRLHYGMNFNRNLDLDGETLSAETIKLILGIESAAEIRDIPETTEAWYRLKEAYETKSIPPRRAL